MNRRLSLLAIVLLSTGLAFAGSYVALGQLRADDGSRLPVSPAYTSDGSTTTVTFSGDELDALRARSLPAQAQLFADGQLTAVEYRSAFYAYSACVRAAGASLAGPDPGQPQPVLSATGVYYFTVTWPREPAQSGGPAETATGQAVADCDATEWRVVQDAWQLKHLPAPELIVAARQALLGCLAERGVEGVPKDAAIGEAWLQRYRGVNTPADTPVFVECLLGVRDRFRLPGFGG